MRTRFSDKRLLHLMIVIMVGGLAGTVVAYFLLSADAQRFESYGIELPAHARYAMHWKEVALLFPLAGFLLTLLVRRRGERGRAQVVQLMWANTALAVLWPLNAVWSHVAYPALLSK